MEIAIAVALALVATSGILVHSPGPGDLGVPVPEQRQGTSPPVPVSEPQRYRPLTSQQAEAANADIPISSAPVEPAAPFTYPGGTTLILSRRSSVDCLTAAIYYEAARENLKGRRAVAQVVLNRVRHPAFPDTVCGVVYQGANRVTGCQFTFTCDGSLAGRPIRRIWDENRRVAEAALSGYVEASVGMATHYHADYVVPYWAASLEKIAAIGTHLFYRWRGGWGRRAAFTQAPQIEPQFDHTRGMTALSEENVSRVDLLKLLEPEEPASDQPALRADELPQLGASPAPRIAIQTAAPLSPDGSATLKADRNAGRLKIDAQKLPVAERPAS